MRVLWIVLAVALSVGVVYAEASPGAPGIGDPYYATLGNGGYDVQHYDIDLTTDVTSNHIDATVTIDATATQDLSSFNLDFNGFAINQLLVNDAPAAYDRDGAELTISPADPLTKGDAFTVEVAYSGEPIGGPDVGGVPIPVEGWNNYGSGVFIASEPAGAQGWFPANDHPLDKASFSFRVTVPEQYVVAANGVLENVIENDDTHTYLWSTDFPMATYLATLHIGDLVRDESVTANGVPIRNYFPTRLAERGKEVYASQGDMVDFFSDTFGPYPFEAYGATVADANLSFALETQTLSLFSRGLLDEGTPAAVQELFISHELAHQWFGDSVTPARWQDVWLNEGFATYAEALWLEHTYGEDVMNGFLVRTYNGIAFGDNEGRVRPGAPPDNDLFDRAVYDRGGWTLHALRLHVGDDAFFSILRTYYDRYKYSNATTEDFIAVAEEVSGEDLYDFFQAWLFDKYVPDVPEMDLDSQNPSTLITVSAAGS